jgi:hypothetical protein
VCVCVCVCKDFFLILKMGSNRQIMREKILISHLDDGVMEITNTKHDFEQVFKILKRIYYHA